MPAENYARAAADFEKADLPREQQRALTRQGRWLIDHNFPKLAIAPLRQAIGLKKSSELQLLLSQALLAMNDAKAARDEAIIGLAELPQDSSSDADLATAARLHYVMARTCLVLAKQIASNPEMAKELEQLDVEAEQHLREALVRATSSKLDEQTTWQDEFSAFQKMPRMLARVERRQRNEKIVELTKGLEQSPNGAAQWIELAELEKLDGQTKAAATHFARGFGLQAMELARAGKLDEAGKAEAKAAEHEADSVQVQYARALIAAGQGRHKDAVTLFDTVLSRSPQLPPLGEKESPSTAQQTLARLHHDRASALETLAVQDNSKPDLALLEQAEKAFAAASSLAPNEPRYALSSGQNLLRQARSSTLGFAELLDRAAIILTTATKLDQQQAEAHFALGDCQFLRGKSAEAQAAFDQAVELAAREPIERQFQFSLSQSLAYLRAPRNDTKALAAADRAILLQRSAPAAHFARGLALRNLKRTNEAIAAFNDSLAAQPKHVGALIARSQLLIEHENATAKQLDQAQQDIEVALAAAATDELKAEAFYVRSLASLKTHVSNVTQVATAEPALLKAQRDLLQAVKLMPSNTVFSQAATELFDYAAKVTWSDSQRKADSDSLQRDWKSARRK